MSNTVKAYYQLTKPGIVRGNTMVGIGGFLLASNGSINPALLLATTIGLATVIASACVVNNFLDRKIDAKMDRTKKRALVSGKIRAEHALVFATVLGLFGFALLYAYTTAVAVFLGALAWYFYVVVYGMWKRQSVHGTLIGTISGALPPVIGYTAVTGSLDITAMLLFLLMVFWQMTHFYSIAIFRLKDYTSAGIPVMPAVKGVKKTKQQMLFYTALFLASVAALSIFGNTGYIFAIVLGVFGIIWLWRGITGFDKPDSVAWARGMFGYSLIVLLTFSILISLNAFLP